MQKKYEVLRLIRQGSGCHIVADYVTGELLATYVQRGIRIQKKQLFSWMRQLAQQLEDVRCVSGIVSYRYLTPFCVVVRSDNTIVLLDLNAKTNETILQNIGTYKIKQLFFPEQEAYNDFYSFGRTIQFLLAKTRLVSTLSIREESRLRRMIGRCLSDNPQKQYLSFLDVIKDIPNVVEKKNNFMKRCLSWSGVMLGLIFVGIAVWGFLEKDSEDAKSPDVLLEEGKEKEEYSKEEIAGLLTQVVQEIDGEKELEYATEFLRVYAKMDTEYAVGEVIELAGLVLQGTQERGEILEPSTEQEIRELLARAYEKSGEKEYALEQYEVLSQWVQDEEIYRVMLRLCEECVLPEKALELCKEGIVFNPDSIALRVFYIRMICKDSAISKEMCEMMIGEMLQECLGLEESIEFKKLQMECGIQVEGGKVWVEK